jgi:carboxylesterase
MDTLPVYRPGAEPRFSRGNEIGCLVLHGFMASPSEVGWLSDHIAQECGYTVYTPRLTGHGVNPQDMNRMRWQDWYLQALDAYNLMRALCDRVYIIGHSMGGLLGLLIAAQYPVDGLVAAAAPLTVPEARMKHTPWLSYLRPYLPRPNGQRLHEIIVAEQLRRGEPTIGRVHYDRWATRAVYELYQLILLTRPYVPDVTAPLLLLYAAADDTVNVDDDFTLQTEVGSRHVERCRVKQGHHILFQDEGRDEAFACVTDFLQRMNNKN